MEDRITVVARHPEELQKAQTDLMAWCDRQKAGAVEQLNLIMGNIDVAVKAGWKFHALNNQERIWKRRVEFYDKLRSALAEGYTILPNMPCDVFAVRTSKGRPSEQIVESRWGSANAKNVPAQELPVGEGFYVDPAPFQRTWSEKQKTTEGKEELVRFAQATGFDEVDFPFILARTEVLGATQQAMALRIFDEIASVPPRRQKGDPMIIGRIHKPGTSRLVSFLITWFIDTNEL